MGVYLYLSIVPNRISADQWHGVYQETLTLLEQFPFLDKFQAENGLWYAIQSRHRDDLFSGECGGWRSFGDMVHGSDTESFYLADDINHYAVKEPDNGADILFVATNDIDADTPPIRRIWADKTQGNASHIYLLAIACLICHRLPDATLIDGDISAGQCRRAVAWANQFLSEPIDVPVTVDMTRLLPRLQNTHIPNGQILDAFLQLSLEARNVKMGQYLSEHLEPSVIEAHFRRALDICPDKEGKMCLNRGVLKTYLQLGLDFSTLCRIVLAEENKKKLEPDNFMELILEMKLHIQEKDTSDMTMSSRDRADSERADTVWGQLLQITLKMRGGSNLNVDAYMPLDEICAGIQTAVGKGYDAKAAAERLLAKGTEDSEESIQSAFYDNPESSIRKRIEKKIEAIQSYDIWGYDDLAEYQEGDSVRPSLETDIISMLHTMAGFADDNLEEYCLMTEDERRKWFTDHYQILLPEEVHQAILDHVMDEAISRRYLAIFLTKVDSENIGYFIHALLWNPFFLNHYWTQMEASTEG